MADVDKLAEIMDDYAFGKEPERAAAIQKLDDYIEDQRRQERIEFARPIVEAIETKGKNPLWHDFVTNWLEFRWRKMHKILQAIRKQYHEDKGGDNA